MFRLALLLLVVGAAGVVWRGDTIDPRSERVALVDLTARFSGTVVDEAGKGIASASIGAYYTATEEQRPSQSLQNDEAAVCGPDGAFDFTLTFRVAPDVETIQVSLSAFHEDFVQAQWLTWTVKHDQHSEALRFELNQGSTFTGSVRDPKGKPVPHARVSFTVWSSSRPDERVRVIPVRFAHCDELGNYSRPGLHPSTKYYVRAEVPGYRTKGDTETHQAGAKHSSLRVDLDLETHSAVVAKLSTSDGRMPESVAFVFRYANGETDELPGWIVGNRIISREPLPKAVSLVIKAPGYDPSRSYHIELKPAEHTDIGEVHLEAADATGDDSK
jgi:hypothetical protein